MFLSRKKVSKKNPALCTKSFTNALREQSREAIPFHVGQKIKLFLKIFSPKMVEEYEDFICSTYYEDTLRAFLL